jgi:hypothetical protein
LHRIEPDVRGPRGRTPRAVGKDEASMHGGDGIFAAEFGDEVVGEIFRREVCDHSGMVADSAVSFTTKDTKITKKNLAGTFPEHGVGSAGRREVAILLLPLVKNVFRNMENNRADILRCRPCVFVSRWYAKFD